MWLFFFIWKYITKILKLTTRSRHQPLGICADGTAGASHNAFIIELSLLCMAFVRTLCHLRMNYRDWPNIWQSRGVAWCPVTSSKLSSLSRSGCCQGVDTFLQDRGCKFEAEVIVMLWVSVTGVKPILSGAEGKRVHGIGFGLLFAQIFACSSWVCLDLIRVLWFVATSTKTWWHKIATTYKFICKFVVPSWVYSQFPGF